MSATSTSNGTARKHGDMRDYASTTLFQPHRAREAIRDAHNKKIPPMIGYYAGLAAVPITRLVAPMGFDFVWIDWEHTAMNIETMTTMVHEAAFFSEGRTIPWVRVPGHDHASIAWAADAGASIVVPQVDTVEQAKHVVNALKYGRKNKGYRSAPPFRYIHNVTDIPYDPTQSLWENFNDHSALMIQIESLEGINNLDAILTEVPEVDVVWLGTIDTRVSMGLPGGYAIQGSEPEWLEAAELFSSIVRKHNKPFAGFCHPNDEGLLNGTGNRCMAVVTGDTMKLAELAPELLDLKAALLKARGIKK
ncbi:HpcH/HpaI aldolase/citrate lyase family protein [Hypoxylon trugodes]|uniref:HpcH/HpaI aldolase/citrate lyase family protein n=1 Tax=Hypoxylon trugodes TaxID=326681 RepID=UPI00218CD8EE|nr:HpcH/HpaI aldolase/citrate lyase family protein [Hypoxylon trugodes]KAI1394383.1 HpcH/HpaI aldolase/citrate lyase family protein [Hypoxylon trugodes]